MTNGRFQEKILDTIGNRNAPDEAFRIPKDDSDFYYTDFMDTEESQKLLQFQNHSFENYLEQMKKEFGWRKIFTKLFNPVVKNWMIQQSPYYKENKT